VTFLQKDTAINTHEFEILVDRRSNGTPAGWGWGTYEDVECPCCGKMYIHVAKAGTKGFKCPDCKYFDPDFMWLDWSDVIAGDGSHLVPVGWQIAKFCPN
jgi:hypothetical protein